MNQALLFAALWISEGWYESWRLRGRIHNKARGIVLYDRVLNGQLNDRDRLDKMLDTAAERSRHA